MFIISQHANGCYLFCLNRKLPDLKSINKLLVLIFILFALNFHMQSSGFGIFFTVLQYLPIFFVVLQCSASFNVPLYKLRAYKQQFTVHHITFSSYSWGPLASTPPNNKATPNGRLC